ncbi:MAG TPA: phosphate starvation-inducible protein PhoH [Holosporales bacterium]|nr:phosphate starvation-inducible protein PhoH [Holosporales bacterium]
MRSQEKSSTTYLEFEDNSLLIELFGSQESNLKLLEKELPVIISTRGNRVMIQGEEENTRLAGTVLASLYLRLQEGKSLDTTDVITALRHAAEKESHDEVFLTTKRRVITARSRQQAAYIQCLKENELVFAEGPAGTGKTYLAVAYGVEMMLAGQMDRLILSRPAVEARERLGFLPGDIREKVDPYLRPLYDALHDMLPLEQVTKKLAVGEIEVAPLAFMRGRTLSDSIIILDEAQNTTEVQMKMFLTRLGNNSRMIITGDLSQIDLPKETPSGLQEAMTTLKGVKGVGYVSFSERDVVRHPLVSKIVRAYEHKKSSH